MYPLQVVTKAPGRTIQHFDVANAVVHEPMGQVVDRRNKWKLETPYLEART